MSKAILVIDMPKNCFHCKLQDWATCRIEKKCHTGDFRPDYCPLREVPQKKEVCGKYPQSDGITPSYKIGWNACIDEILKGAEKNG